MDYTKRESKAWAREKLVGQWTTMITPFTSDDRLDEKGLAHNVEHVLKLGTKGMGFSWNMGEFWSLSQAERLALMEAAQYSVRRRALTAFQVTDTRIKEVAYMCSKAADLGYDFVILAPPYIVTKTEEQVVDFVSRVAAQTDIGIAFYNSPQFGIVLSAKALSKIADIENVIAIKEASFNMQLSIDTHLQAGSKVVVSTPDEEIFPLAEMYGFSQQVMFANTSDWRFDTPSRHSYVNYIDLATHGEYEKARTLYEKIRPVKLVSRKWWSRLVARTNGSLPVQMVKYWGELMGLKAGHVRPPLIPLTEQEKAELKAELEALGVTASAPSIR
ncbi:MAG: dihydrodipicolinate synthase family protein [Thermoprotei archaeon]